jgi:multicomponent Na+:H+ antiporter subunit C
MELLGKFNYWIFIALMMSGFYLLLSARNLIKKIIGLNLFQTSVFVFYISTGAIRDGHVPIRTEGVDVYSNPLPHTLILTAIVVGVASTALGLALILRIKDEYGTIEEDEVDEQDVLS